MATRLNPTNFGYQNFYSALLTADITSGTLVISLDTVPTPSAGILVIDPDSTTGREVIVYTSKGASTITCPSDGRGYSGTTAAAHLTGTTVIMAPIDKWFTALASGELSTDPLRTEGFYDYVASGLVWTADAAGSTRNASMTSGVLYILGRRLTLVAVTARTFTASKDTYIDVSDNGDGTGLITYNEVANNAASPALSTNNVRIGIIVTAAGSIAAAGSVNQGEGDKVLPIASSIAYTTTDSLGNLICPRDPLRKVLGYKQIIANFTSGGTANTLVTGLTCPVIVPTGRKVRVTVCSTSISLTPTQIAFIEAWDGTVGSGTQISQMNVSLYTGGANHGATVTALTTPTSASKTYNAAVGSTGSVPVFGASAAGPGYILVELA